MPRTGYAKQWDTPAAIAARAMVYQRSEADRRLNAGFLLGRVGLRFMNRTERDTLRSLTDWLSVEDLENGKTLVTPSNAEIGEDLGVQERTVQKTLDALERDGWIVRDWNDRHRRFGGGAGIDLAPLYCRLGELQAAFEARCKGRHAVSVRARRPQLAVAVDNCRESDGKIAAGVKPNAPMDESQCIPTTEPTFRSINLDGCKADRREQTGDKLVRRSAGPRLIEPPDDPEIAFARLRAAIRWADPNRVIARRHLQSVDDASSSAAFDLAKEFGVQQRVVAEAIRRHGAVLTLAALAVVLISLARDAIRRSPAALATTLLRDAPSLNLWRTINHVAANGVAYS